MGHDPLDDSARLARVEAQTQVLAEALVALTAQSEAVVKAIDAVKDEMTGSTAGAIRHAVRALSERER